MSVTTEFLEGSCLCGAAAFRVTGPPRFMSHCHCTDCRKAHAAAFATFVTVDRDRVTWIRGFERLGRHTAGSGAIRSFCPGCGSLLAWEKPGDPTLDLPAALFDTPLRLTPRDHLFVRSKVDWFEIADGLPQHSGHRGMAGKDGPG